MTRLALLLCLFLVHPAFATAPPKLDPGCDTREDARLLYNMGLQAESVARLCAKPEMAAALGPKCPKKD